MLLQVSENCVGQLSLPTTWQTLHPYFDPAARDMSLRVVNDSLVGFFQRGAPRKIVGCGAASGSRLAGC